MLYPYRFQPLLMERVWGGRELARYGKSIPPDRRIGESWEITDRDEAQSVVVNGPDKGKTLRQLIETHGAQLLGTNCRNAKRFPLLVKLLDARDRLSLQVHPPAGIAAKLRGDPKTEMWYVLDADTDAHLIAGMRRGVTGADFIRAIERAEGKLASAPGITLDDCAHRLRVTRGDVFFVPSGRMHAIDAGLVLVEIQQNSDTTYRVYDWGRVGLDGQPRQLHTQQSIASIDFNDFEPKKVQPRVESVTGGNGLWRLIECEHFHVHKLDVHNAWTLRCDGATFHVLACVTGELGILTPDGKEERLPVGEFTLLPAALGAYILTPLAEMTTALKAFVPAMK